MPYNNNGEFYNDIPSAQGVGSPPPELQTIIDKALSYATSTIPGARGQTRAQGDVLSNLAHTVGGVYGNQLSQNTALAGQNLQAKAEEGRNALGVGELGVRQGQLAENIASSPRNYKPSESVKQALERLLGGNRVGGTGDKASGQSDTKKDPYSIDWNHNALSILE
jgi:hypothetical protein